MLRDSTEVVARVSSPLDAESGEEVRVLGGSARRSAVPRARKAGRTSGGLPRDARELQGSLEDLLGGALELHGADRGDVRLYDAVSRTLRPAVSSGLGLDLLTAWGAVELSEAGSPWATAVDRDELCVADVRRELPQSPLRQGLLECGVRAVLCVPLRARRGGLVGAITVYFSRAQTSDERLLRLTAVFARQGAEAIERVRAEAERARLLRSEQNARRALDEAARMKDAFLAVVSHELRAPLTAILLWSKLLQRAGGDPQRTQQAIAAIVDGAEAQARLMDALLDTARAAAGKLRLKVGETDLADVVVACIAHLALVASAKGLRVEVNLSGDVGVVLADEVRLRQVVGNLLGNAIKFTPQGGRVMVSLTRASDEVRLVVSDDGAGISAELLPRIFERYRQGTAIEQAGLGLGLTICKELVELHGGTIQAESSGPHLGATLTVRLPMPALRHAGEEGSRAPEPVQALTLARVASSS
jgi:signal transduction histidine kinase